MARALRSWERPCGRWWRWMRSRDPRRGGRYRPATGRCASSCLRLGARVRLSGFLGYWNSGCDSVGVNSLIGQDLPVLEPDLARRLPGDVEVVGDDDDGDLVLAVEAFQKVDQLLRGLGVDRACRL